MATDRPCPSLIVDRSAAPTYNSKTQQESRVTHDDRSVLFHLLNGFVDEIRAAHRVSMYFVRNAACCVLSVLASRAAGPGCYWNPREKRRCKCGFVANSGGLDHLFLLRHQRNAG